MSSNDNEASDQEEAVTAGMDLTFAGTQIRPFLFFNGQGELMGHVWSGTASEMTPAFQVSNEMYMFNLIINKCLFHSRDYFCFKIIWITCVWEQDLL